MSVFNFNEYTTEDTYNITKDGVEKSDWECYKDFYPEKWLYINFTEQKENKIFEHADYIWVIKYKGDIQSIFPSTVSESVIKNIVEILKKSFNIQIK